MGILAGFPALSGYMETYPSFGEGPRDLSYSVKRYLQTIRPDDVLGSVRQVTLFSMDGSLDRHSSRKLSQYALYLPQDSSRDKVFSPIRSQGRLDLCNISMPRQW